MPKQLRRSLGLTTGIAASCGIVVASTTLVDMGHGFGLAGMGFIIPMLIAMFLNLMVALSFGELSAMIPRAGAINHYTLPAMGSFMGIFAVISGYIIVQIFAGSAEAAIPGLVIQQLFLPGIDPRVFSAIILLFLMAINIRGIDLFGWTQIILTVIMIGSLIVVGFIGLTGTGTGTPVVTELDPAITGWGLLGLTALAFWLFIGLEFVVPIAEEMRKPRIYVPLSMIIGLGIIFIAKAIFGSASVGYVPLDTLATSETPHLEAGFAILGRSGEIWLGIVTIAATMATLNTLICGIPRMLFGMAQEGQAPSTFAALNRWQTPWVGIIFSTLIILVPNLLGIFTIEVIIIYILAAVFSWFVCYIIAHLDVIILRYKYPDVKRHFRSPLGILPQIIGIIAMVYMMINIFPDPDMKRQIYLYALVFLGIAAIYSALWVKLKMKQGLFETTPLEKLTDENYDEQ